MLKVRSAFYILVGKFGGKRNRGSNSRCEVDIKMERNKTGCECEISSSHGGEYDVQSCHTAVYPRRQL
jgi:hypothetical protein